MITMRIKLEYEDGPVFSTVQYPSGRYRAMMIKIDGKPFTTWRTIEAREFYLSGSDQQYLEEIDKTLVASMERMLTKVFLDAVAAVPEGTELTKE